MNSHILYDSQLPKRSTNLPIYLLVVGLLTFSLGLSACQVKPIQQLFPARLAPPKVITPDLSPVSLNDLTDLSQLQAAFNADQGSPRLILLLSPT